MGPPAKRWSKSDGIRRKEGRWGKRGMMNKVGQLKKYWLVRNSIKQKIKPDYMCRLAEKCNMKAENRQRLDTKIVRDKKRTLWKIEILTEFIGPLSGGTRGPWHGILPRDLTNGGKWGLVPQQNNTITKWSKHLLAERYPLYLKTATT